MIGFAKSVITQKKMFGITNLLMCLPAVAERIDSYGDKQKIMKKYNIVEANDPVKGSREHRIEPPKSSSIRSEWADKPNNAKMWGEQWVKKYKQSSQLNPQ